MADPKAVTDKASLVLDHPNRVAVVTLSGAWTVTHLPKDGRITLEGIPAGFQRLIVHGGALGEVDTSGAWLMLSTIRQLPFTPEQVEWVGFSTSHEKLLGVIARMQHESFPEQKNSAVYKAFMELGKYCVGSVEGTITLTSFFGQLFLSLWRIVLHPSRLRFKSVVYHVNEVGIQAIPIVILMAFFISLVLGYQGANQLRLFGAKEYTINLVAISHLREMGVIITAIMLAGRSCSAFAAQLGVMQMNEEIAAMRTLGLDPFELLVIPRLLGVIIALPVLAFIADITGLFGTYFMASFYLGMSFPQFADRVLHAANDMTFYVGLMKAPVFAFYIGIIGCYQGLQVRTSATELGLRTTAAVVQSIFWIVLMDAVFSVIFTMLNL